MGHANILSRASATSNDGAGSTRITEVSRRLGPMRSGPGSQRTPEEEEKGTSENGCIDFDQCQCRFVSGPAGFSASDARPFRGKPAAAHDNQSWMRR